MAHVRRIPVPPSVRAASTLPRIDYADTFTVAVNPAEAQRWTGESWARAALEGAPLALRTSLLAGWTALGLALRPAPADDRVLGWAIRRREADLVLLGATSRIGLLGELLFQRQADRLLFATFVTHENIAARTLWAGVPAVHDPIVRNLLERAAVAGPPAVGAPVA